MTGTTDSTWVRSFVEEHRYLMLATTDGTRPWVAAVEYLVDEDLTFFFFSKTDARHSRDIAGNPTIAGTVVASEQPDYAPDLTEDLNAIQFEGTARRLSEAEYPEAVAGAIDALDLAMPPYAAYAVVPSRVFVPRIEDGENVRYEVEIG
ncbi:MAG: pyridoxamine 5'-phosphate oxidase family protein [Acidimicrobiia bacterium]|nr:pyridoxamine 5'-phosphate oxidase family protein [Acidimicrobiia bacterium]